MLIYKPQWFILFAVENIRIACFFTSSTHLLIFPAPGIRIAAHK